MRAQLQRKVRILRTCVGGTALANQHTPFRSQGSKQTNPPTERLYIPLRPFSSVKSPQDCSYSVLFLTTSL
ncbi:hypothetical protein XELAEV_18003109mg [Xenopus laevis]|uniref:Uncharacterized protein n=1 Tax=Xenopus laevis TaxID=8355 RepID=A0A974BNC4_XENLA|nr:hypothetical protein XELAEV_18003109mg [Xenopus laevis]